MSAILNAAAVQALREAYGAYLNRDLKTYRYHLQVANNAIEAIRALDGDPDRGREFELMYLDGEKTLVEAFAEIGRPKELLRKYEYAAKRLAVPPSRILTADMPYLPPDLPLCQIFPCMEENPEQAAEDFSTAIGIYSRLTGGGGDGTDALYRAVLSLRQGALQKARDWAREARVIGGGWMQPYARLLSEEIEKGEMN